MEAEAGCEGVEGTGGKNGAAEEALEVCGVITRAAEEDGVCAVADGDAAIGENRLGADMWADGVGGIGGGTADAEGEAKPKSDGENTGGGAEPELRLGSGGEVMMRRCWTGSVVDGVVGCAAEEEAEESGRAGNTTGR